MADWYNKKSMNGTNLSCIMNLGGWVWKTSKDIVFCFLLLGLDVGNHAAWTNCGISESQIDKLPCYRQDWKKCVFFKFNFCSSSDLRVAIDTEVVFLAELDSSLHGISVYRNHFCLGWPSWTHQQHRIGRLKLFLNICGNFVQNSSFREGRRSHNPSLNWLSSRITFYARRVGIYYLWYYK